MRRVADEYGVTIERLLHSWIDRIQAVYKERGIFPEPTNTNASVAFLVVVHWDSACSIGFDAKVGFTSTVLISFKRNRTSSRSRGPPGAE